MENKMEKRMENEMETGIIWGFWSTTWKQQRHEHPRQAVLLVHHGLEEKEGPCPLPTFLTSTNGR